MRFIFTASHTSGKDLTIVDMLSHTSTAIASNVGSKFSQDAETVVNTVMSCLVPVTEKR